MTRYLISGSLLFLLWIFSSCQSEARLDDSLLVTAKEVFDRDDFALAEPLFLQIIEETKAAGVSSERKVSALFHLGELFRIQGYYEKAELLFWQALPIWAKTIGPTHPEIAKGLTSLAYVFEAKLEYQKAAPLVKQALKDREAAFGRDHPNIVPSLEQYAALLKLMNRQDEAGALMSRGHTIQAKHSTS